MSVALHVDDLVFCDKYYIHGAQSYVLSSLCRIPLAFINLTYSFFMDQNIFTFREVHTEYTTLARSHRYSRGFGGDLFFTMVDYDGGAAIFQRVCIYSKHDLDLR